MTRVYDIFKDSCARFADRPFIHIPALSAAAYHDGAVDYTYAEVDAEITKLLGYYGKAGYGTGHRVGVLLENRAAFFFHWLALNALGVSIVPLNGEFSRDEMSYVISHSETDLVITLADKKDHVLSSLETAIPVITPGDMATVSGPKKPKSDEQISKDTECAILYTSGSTGQPKGCILSNEYFTYFGEWYRDVGGYCTLREGQERLLTPLPLVHMNALGCSTMAMMITGGCIIQLDRFHPRTWWQLVRETGATALHYLGVLPAILLNLPESDQDRDHKVRFGFGAGVNPKHHAKFEDRFGFPLIEAWAMTESGAGGCIIAHEEPRHVGTCCFGKVSDQVEIKLIDEAGKQVAEGAPGELLVRATGDDPQRGFFRHYFKNDAATAETWKDNWLHTGDVVRRGEDGSLFFVDRRKNVIRRSGENISALEVETVLSLNPAIDKLAVAPAYDEIRGDEVMACIVLKDGRSATEQLAREIFDSSCDQLAYYKTPGYIAFISALPLTASQKLKRGEMKALCADLIKKGQVYDLRSFKKRTKPKEMS
ncbi:MAG: ATP-dependent acyl-CoA ligase [Alphaproteobacteria bacterium]|nr:MAG: ATP-dependent acyl-CoA ligase [Alphaproteobacteria bacterium]